MTVQTGLCRTKSETQKPGFRVMCAIYFRYLFELLYSWLYSTVQRAESFIFEHEAYIGKRKLLYLLIVLIEPVREKTNNLGSN